MAKGSGLVNLDISNIIARMQAAGETYNSQRLDARTVEDEYRRFLTLRKRYPGVRLVPSRLIDRVWHYHILDTSKYTRDTKRIFGEYLHHDPGNKTKLERNGVQRKAGWKKTNA